MSRLPRVAQLNLARGFRGGEQQTLALIEALVGKVSQRAVVNRDGLLIQRLDTIGIEVAPVGNPFSAAKALDGCDLVHVHEGRGAQSAALGWLRSRTPFIVTRRIPQSPSAGALWCMRRASKVVAVSVAIERALAMREPRLNLTTVHDCVPQLDADPGAAARLRGDAGLIVGQSGELHDAHKGQMMTIAAAARLAASHPRVQFWLIGSGRDEARLRDEAAGNDNVKFVGWTDRIGDYYCALDVLVYPSRYEGLGSALLEAMHFGVPVIAARVGGIPEIVNDGRDGLLFEAGDLDDFASKLTLLLDDSGLRQRLASGAREQAARYSAAAMATRYRELYEQILASA